MSMHMFLRRPSVKLLAALTLLFVGLHLFYTGGRVSFGGPRTRFQRLAPSAYPPPPGEIPAQVVAKPDDGPLDHAQNPASGPDVSASTSSAVDTARTSVNEPLASEPLPPHERPAGEGDVSFSPPSSSTRTAMASHVAEATPPSSPPACSEAEGRDDIVYVIKTGSTEVLEKLPVHFNTTMKCWPHVFIFSDFGETLDGHTIHDALDNVIDDIRLRDNDFELWRRLKEHGREALNPEELSDHNHVQDPNSGSGNFGSGGWRLDKFKNIPMVGKTLQLKPDAKWYLFTDADTFVSWSNLLRWTAMLDHTKPLYLGSPAVIGEQIFGHGGSGYLLSQPAMRAASDLYEQNQDEWDRYASIHWAGDCVLATLLEQQLALTLTWAYPIIQGGDPVLMDWADVGYDRRLWCYPAVSYHHLLPHTIESLWQFEQDRMSGPAAAQTLKHSDVFREWVLPQLAATEQPGWDNHAADLVEGSDGGADGAGIMDSARCRAVCEANSTCVQYSFGAENRCKTYDKPRIGNAETADIRSGWMVERIQQYIDGFAPCEEGDWILG